MKKTGGKSGVLSAVWAAASERRLLSAGTILCTAASVLAALLPPLLLGRLVDSLTGGVEPALSAILLYFGSLALGSILNSAQETLLEMFGQKMTHALRSEMSQKMTRLPASTLAAQDPGQVSARFSGDVDAVEALFTSGVISMAADACRILSILAVIFVRNRGLALLLLAALPLLAVFTRFVQKRMLSAQLENRRAISALSGQVPETIRDIRTIHALGMEAYMERRYDASIARSYSAVEKTNLYDAAYSPVVMLFDAALVGVVMALSASGGPAARLFGMSVGTSVTMIDYISRVFAPIESLGMEIQTIQSAMAGVRRIDAFLAQPERELVGSGEKACPRGDLVLSHVTFGYDERKILSDLSLTVKAGEQATLIGRTGVGKSTVFRLLLGMYRPDSGSVTIGGVEAWRIPDNQRRRCIGCVEQHFSRVPGTVLDQITLGDPTVTREMAEQAARLVGLEQTIQGFPAGYDTPCTDGLFSQGEWQLLSIARAAAADPYVLLLDEITANLDAETETLVMDALRRASAGRTVLSISHRIYERLGGRTIELLPPGQAG